MPYSLRYEKMFRARENVFPKIDEAFVQRLWFEQAYQNPLITTTREKIEILQPGFWNRQGGPDFLQACLFNEKGEREVGAVEIHLGMLDWHSHAHEKNSEYEKVILHIVWKLGAKEFFPRKIDNRFIRQIELSSQLRLPLDRLQSVFTSLPHERKIGARAGKCESVLSKLSKEKIQETLEDAGWYRFYRKKALWDARMELLGAEQSLWMGLAESLGYSGNKEPFKLIAQRLKIQNLLKIQPTERREALLFGIAGFLPDKILPKHSESVRKLWDCWWMDRAEWQDFILPKKFWKLDSVRPVNRPERRLAVLALLSEKKTWREFLELARAGELEKIETWFEKLLHPFWSHHFTFQSAPSKNQNALLGKDRIHAILFNIIWPIFHRDENKLRTWFSKISFSNVNRPVRIAGVRLLANRKLPKTLLAQEGLLQIYEDFCLKDLNQCKDCEFVSRIKI